MHLLYPGSFNPFTKGHADILKRLLEIADRVTVAIGVNINKPHSQSEADRNAAEIRAWVAKTGIADRVEVKTYKGLTALFAREVGATCMARGVRNATDFDYEYSLAAANRRAFGIETILLPANPELSFISSSLIRDLEANGADDIASEFRV